MISIDVTGKGRAKPAGKQPDIVLIMSDDQGWGDLPLNWSDRGVVFYFCSVDRE